MGTELRLTLQSSVCMCAHACMHIVHMHVHVCASCA